MKTNEKQKSFGRVSLLSKHFRRSHKKFMSFRHEGLPYYSQWESRDLIGPLIRQEISAKDDPQWRSSGANDVQEYALWGRNLCGMACVKMILAHKHGKEHSLIDLGKKCMEYGGYVQKGTEINGLYYKPFLDFIVAEFDLSGKIISPMSQEDILEQSGNKNYVIASVSHQIRHPEIDFKGKKGGHLVVVVASDIDNSTFYIHNPSGDTRESQEYAPISFKNFEKFFAHRGIVIFNDGTEEDRQVL